jgi:putative PIN family toxin of toxin-antitoxin system
VYDGNELKAIFRSLEEGHTLVISEHIEEEILRVMLDKFPEHSKLFHEFISLAGFEIVHKDKYLNKMDNYNIVRDKHDRHVLASASSSKCELIITGDKDLLILKKIDNIRIIKAKELIILLK